MTWKPSLNQFTSHITNHTLVCTFHLVIPCLVFYWPNPFLGILIELLNRKSAIKRKLIFNKVWVLIHSAVQKFQIRIAQIGTFLKFLWSSYDELSIYLSQCGKPSMGLAKNGSQNGQQHCMPRFTQRIAIKWRKKQKGIQCNLQ